MNEAGYFKEEAIRPDPALVEKHKHASAEYKFKSVVLKIGSAGFSMQGSAKFTPTSLFFLADEIKMALKFCPKIIVVPGGGSIIRGRELKNFGVDDLRADHCGMLSTMIVGTLLEWALEERGVEVRHQSALEMKAVAEPDIPKRVRRHLEKGRVVIISGGIGKAGVTTDSAAIDRAVESNAEVVLKGTAVDGVYDDDPQKFLQAKLYRVLTYEQVQRLEVRVFDHVTIAKAQEAKIPIVVFQWSADNLSKVIQGDPEVGSLIGDRKTIERLRPQYLELCDQEVKPAELKPKSFINRWFKKIGSSGPTGDSSWPYGF